MKLKQIKELPRVNSASRAFESRPLRINQQSPKGRGFLEMLMKHIGKVFQSSEGDNLQQILDRLGDRIKTDPRTSGPEPTPETKTTAKIIQLPLWPEPARGVPNSLLRGALFAAIQNNHRRKGMVREVLAAQGGIQISFTGIQLIQADLDVWEYVLHMVKQDPLGTHGSFTAYQCLKALGRNTGQKNYEWLKDTIAILTACTIEIAHDERTYGGHLLLSYIRDEETHLYELWPDPSIIKLYNAGWTAVDWDQRQLLRRQPLALWLHGLYASHAKPFALTIDYIYKLCGSNTQRTRKFKESLTAAYIALEKVGAIKGFEIRDGKVIVENVPSDSQKKHIRKSERSKE